MEKLGQLVYNKRDLISYYKGKVPTPPLRMVEDVLGIQHSSKNSKMLNGSIYTFVEFGKLKLSEQKCHSVHIGTRPGGQ